jgi:dolichol-phosphate mannosyltransferase
MELKGQIDKDDVTVIVPTLNEERAIELVLSDLYLEGYSKTVVIDGNSIDDTVSIVKKMRVPVYAQVGAGKTGAIKTALDYVKTPYLAIIDGDCTYSAKDIGALLEKAPQYNQVIGARSDRSNIKIINRFGNSAINLLFNLFFGTNLTDVCSGLYVMSTSFAKEITLETGGFDVEVEIAAQAAKSSKITEVPISYGKRVGVQKLNPVKDGVAISTSILKLSKKYNPLVFYSYLFGFILAGTGFGYVVISSVDNLSFSLIGASFLLGGIILLASGLFLSRYKLNKTK